MTHFAVTQNRPPSDRRLHAVLAGLGEDAPIVVMVHGYKYDPRIPDHDPHRHIFALHPDPRHKRAASWPKRLGLRGRKGLAVGFGWHASGTLWQAHREAVPAANQLAALITRLHRNSPDRSLHIVAHSLGARVALRALRLVAPGTVDRTVLIAAAVFESELATALAHPAGQSTEIINIRSKANTLFDLLLRAALPHWGCTAGRGRLPHPSLLDINIDCAATKAAFSGAGFPLGRPSSRVCHWSGYLRDDACALYRNLLHRPGQTPLPYLQSLVPTPLLARPVAHADLSF